MINSSYPAISVIIPLYNAEKYIGECLESLLLQTFQNFEVIVVDDCSTDNSIEVVKNYAPKFDGRLQLAKTLENSGNPGESQNIGLSLSRGEYFFILEGDDVIIPSAFEDLYPAAKKFAADFVIWEGYYEVSEDRWNDIEFIKQLKPVSYQEGGYVDETTLITDSMAERVQSGFDHRFLFPLWTKLINRDFFIRNHLRFTNNVIQDVLTTLCMVCVAEKYVRVPYVVNCYRVRKASLSHEKLAQEKHLQKYVRSLTTAFEYMDDFFKGRKFFQEHSDMKYLVLETCFRQLSLYFDCVYTEIPNHELDALLREEFSNGKHTALMAFIFNKVNVQRLQLILAQQQVDQFTAQAQERIAQLEAEVNRLKT